MSDSNWDKVLIFAAGAATTVASLAAYRALSAKRAGSVVKPALKKWIPGENQPIPFKQGGWKSYASGELKKSGGTYGLLISTVVPRPIALISSQSVDGHLNCAPYSYFNTVCHDPPLMVVGINLNVRSGTKKDTLNNIEQTGQFVINIMSSWYLESANHTSGPYPPDQNEFELAGLTTLPSEVVKPPRVAESAVQFECEVVDIQPRLNDDGVHTVSVVTARVVRFHVHEEVLTEESAGKLNKPVVDWAKLQPVGRLGGDIYTVVQNGIDIPRPR
eukprot:gene22791-25818_t